MYAVHKYSSCSLKQLFSKCSPKISWSLQSLCTPPHKWVFNTHPHERKGSLTCRWILWWSHTLINNSINKTPGLTAWCSIHASTAELFTSNEQLMAWWHDPWHITQCHVLLPQNQSSEPTEWPGGKDADKTFSFLGIPVLTTLKHLGEIDASGSILLKFWWPGWVANLASSWALLPANPCQVFLKNLGGGGKQNICG